MIRRLVAWWRRRWSHPEISRVDYYATQADVPEALPPQALAIVGSVDQPKWALFHCPCGRGHRLSVNLSRNRRPYWLLEVDRAGPSLYPSVDYRDDHRCHFWLRNGRVSWVPRWPRRTDEP